MYYLYSEHRQLAGYARQCWAPHHSYGTLTSSPQVSGEFYVNLLFLFSIYLVAEVVWNIAFVDTDAI